MSKNVVCPEELKPFGPFYHDIDLGAGYNTAPESRRMKNAELMFWKPILKVCGGSLEGKRVLDVGCNCGGFSFLAQRAGAKEVVGIDIRQENIEQAKAIQRYLGIDNITFAIENINNITPEKYGQFDLVILAGIAYHLVNPIESFKIISKVCSDVMFVDSRIHFSSDPQKDDIASWWMLADSDRNDATGLDDGLVDKQAYYQFERRVPVDYNILKSNQILSPQTERDIKFINESQVNEKFEQIPEGLCSEEVGELVMMPNEKALIYLMRNVGFNDIVKILPKRFAEERYVRNYRVCYLGMK